eukprot:s2228_g6.t1
MEEVVLSYLPANRIEAERKIERSCETGQGICKLSLLLLQAMELAQAISLTSDSFVHRGYHGRINCGCDRTCRPMARSLNTRTLGPTAPFSLI